MLEADVEGVVVPCDPVDTEALAAPGAPSVLSGVLDSCVATDFGSLSASWAGDDICAAFARGGSFAC